MTRQQPTANSQRLACVFLLLISFGATAGELPGFKAVVEGKHYIVRANIPEDDAKQIAQDMEQTHERYLSFFQSTSPDRIQVYIYSSRDEYNAVHPGAAGSEGAFYAGFRWREQMIVSHRDSDLGQTLRHEIAHQFVHHKCAFDVERSSALRGLFGLPDSVARLPSVPVWLHEGIAQYLAVTDEGLTNPWKMDTPKFRRLQKQLRDGDMNIQMLLAAKSYFGDFPGDYYPVAWGVVYFLTNDKDPKKEKQKKELLWAYLAACKNPLLNLAMNEVAENAPGPWADAWYKVVNLVGIATFEANIAKNGKTLYCNVVAQSDRGVLAIIDNEQTFFSAAEIAAVDWNRDASSRRYRALIVKEATTQVAGPGDPNKVVGRKEFKGVATLLDKIVKTNNAPVKKRQ